MSKLIDQLATGESPAVEGVFDAENEAQLAEINPTTAAAIRSIARQLAAANTAHTRGYTAGYLDGVRERLNMPSVEVAPTVADTVPAVEVALDLTVVERHFDDLYIVLQEWTAKGTTPERTYVSAGHDAVKAIDDTIRALHLLRSELVTEIRSDEDERNVRVDALLAASRADRAAEVTA